MIRDYRLGLKNNSHLLTLVFWVTFRNSLCASSLTFSFILHKILHLVLEKKFDDGFTVSTNIEYFSFCVEIIPPPVRRYTWSLLVVDISEFQ